jgi:hypothetical protein
MSEPEYVVVPAHPAAHGDRTDVRFELRQGPAGEVVGVAFTTVAKLVEQLGRFQPWMVLKTAGYRELLARVQVQGMVLDPVVDPATVHWSEQALQSLVEVNDHGGV